MTLQMQWATQPVVFVVSFNLNLIGLFSTERGQRDLENLIIECDLRKKYSPLHLQCHWISMSNLNLLGLSFTERGERDLENLIIDYHLRKK